MQGILLWPLSIYLVIPGPGLPWEEGFLDDTSLENTGETWTGSLTEEPSGTRRSWSVEVYFTLAGSEGSNLPRSEP